ncbi:hypothetical protein SAMN05216262_10112 [Colwellia chukchiensis]|uniref:Uncharacterized protein n=1 Tax=Colwellia chukchiensis TaxID=641665 RepID=A0A1H7FV97_9GAMM|nr:TapY2 family type IVa secretion system protein [Colwellia chukchiensis]SEK30016.1 hypothetical protein SAMN05216262_10112 [Colwellia chukchiensis]
MNVKMLLFTLCVVVSSMASAADKSKQSKKIDVKCHVELYGGLESIYFASVPENKLNKLDVSLSNRKIATVYSKQKQQVYRVFECAKLTEAFSSAKARNLFAKYPR